MIPREGLLRERKLLAFSKFRENLIRFLFGGIQIRQKAKQICIDSWLYNLRLYTRDKNAVWSDLDVKVNTMS